MTRKCRTTISTTIRCKSDGQYCEMEDLIDIAKKLLELKRIKIGYDTDKLDFLFNDSDVLSKDRVVSKLYNKWFGDFNKDEYEYQKILFTEYKITKMNIRYVILLLDIDDIDCIDDEDPEEEDSDEDYEDEDEDETQFTVEDLSFANKKTYKK